MSIEAVQRAVYVGRADDQREIEETGDDEAASEQSVAGVYETVLAGTGEDKAG